MVSRAAAKAIKAGYAKKVKTAKLANREKVEREWLRSYATFAGKVAPACTAIPAWISRVHFSHNLLERGGLFCCYKCGGTASHKPQKLLGECKAEGDTHDAWRLVRKAARPRGVPRWPSGWTAATPPLLRRVFRQELQRE